MSSDNAPREGQRTHMFPTDEAFRNAVGSLYEEWRNRSKDDATEDFDEWKVAELVSLRAELEAAQKELRDIIPNQMWKQYNDAVDKAADSGALKQLKNMEAAIGRKFIEVALRELEGK